MPSTSRRKSPGAKMRTYRQGLRRQGLRPVQIWVPDCNAKGFQARLRRQIQRLDPAVETDALRFIAAVQEPSE